MKKWTTLLKLVLILSVAVVTGLFIDGLAQHILVILVMIALLKLASGKEKHQGVAGTTAKDSMVNRPGVPATRYKAGLAEHT